MIVCWLKKIGIDAKHIGCVADESIFGYNELMDKKIATKFGKDYWIKPKLQADSIHLYHLPRLGKSYIYYQQK